MKIVRSAEEKAEHAAFISRHRGHMRFNKAVALVRDTGTEKKMTGYQAQDACEYLCLAFSMTHDQFADAVLAHAGHAAYFMDWTED